MIKFDSSHTYNLDEFTNLQDSQMNTALNKLNLLKEEIMKLTYIACIVILQS